MSFERPFFVFMLWIVPVALGLLLYSQWRSNRRILRFFREEMVKRLVPEKSDFRRTIKTVLFSISIGLLLFSLSGPMFGVYFEDVERRGADIFVAIDVSRSMLAEDVHPNRLERAKTDVQALLEKVEGDRVGLIAFAGKPIVRVPLTNDFEFYREVLRGLNTDSAPEGGTAIGDAIRLGIRSMFPEPDRDRILIIISDGEDHDSMPLFAAEDAKANGIRIISVVFGDSVEGGLIPIEDESGNRTFLKFDGEEVRSKASGETLEKVANMTEGGVYLPVGTKSYDFSRLYDDYLSDVKRGASAVHKQRRLHTQYQGFLAFGIFCLMLELAIPVNRARKFSPQHGFSE